MAIVARLIVVMIVAIAPTHVLADPKADAQEHVERAQQHFKAERVQEALTELETAYQLDPDPSLLYAIGTALAKLGRCTDAKERYERFLAANPADRYAAQARQAMSECKPALDESTPKPKAVPDKIAGPVATPAPTPPPAQATSRPWYGLKLGWALVGAGAGAAIASGILYGSASNDFDASEQAPTYDDASDLVDSGKRKHLYSMVAGGSALGLMAAGVCYFMFVGRHTESDAVSIVPTPSGAAVAWTGRF